MIQLAAYELILIILSTASLGALVGFVACGILAAGSRADDVHPGDEP